MSAVQCAGCLCRIPVRVSLSVYSEDVNIHIVCPAACKRHLNPVQVLTDRLSSDKHDDMSLLLGEQDLPGLEYLVGLVAGHNTPGQDTLDIYAALEQKFSDDRSELEQCAYLWTLLCTEEKQRILDHVHPALQARIEYTKKALEPASTDPVGLNPYEDILVVEVAEAMGGTSKTARDAAAAKKVAEVKLSVTKEVAKGKQSATKKVADGKQWETKKAEDKQPPSKKGAGKPEKDALKATEDTITVNTEAKPNLEDSPVLAEASLPSPNKPAELVRRSLRQGGLNPVDPSPFSSNSRSKPVAKTQPEADPEGDDQDTSKFVTSFYKKWTPGREDVRKVTVTDKGTVRYRQFNHYALWMEDPSTISKDDSDSWPPSTVRLDDSNVGKLIDSKLTLRTRGNLWIAEFDQKGHIRGKRMPLGNPYLIWADREELDGDGNKIWTSGWYYAVYRGYYCLMGEEGVSNGTFAMWRSENRPQQGGDQLTVLRTYRAHNQPANAVKGESSQALQKKMERPPILGKQSGAKESSPPLTHKTSSMASSTGSVMSDKKAALLKSIDGKVMKPPTGPVGASAKIKSLETQVEKLTSQVSDLNLTITSIKDVTVDGLKDVVAGEAHIRRRVTLIADELKKLRDLKREERVGRRIDAVIDFAVRTQTAVVMDLFDKAKEWATQLEEKGEDALAAELIACFKDFDLDSDYEALTLDTEDEFVEARKQGYWFPQRNSAGSDEEMD